MPFPIKLILDPAGRYLLVQQGEEESAPAASLFLSELKDNLRLITEAAQARINAANQNKEMHLHCSSRAFSSYVIKFPQGAESRLPWQALPGGFSTDSTVAMLRKLILFLQEEGCRRFPEIFKDRTSEGLGIIKRSLEILSRLREGDSQPLPPIGSRKRKGFLSFKRPDAKKLALESSGTAAAFVPQVGSSVVEKVLEEEMPSGSTEAEAISLRSDSIQLFDPEVYQGPDSEEEEESQVLSTETSEDATRLMMTSQEEKRALPIPVPFTKISTKTSKSASPHNVIPICFIEKSHHQIISNTFCLRYSTRSYATDCSSLKLTLIRLLQSTCNNIALISELKENAKMMFKEPFDNEGEGKAVSKEEIFLKTLQGLEAVYMYIEEKDPKLLKGYKRNIEERYLKKAITLLRTKLQNVSPVVLENLLTAPISTATPLLPREVLDRLVREKKIAQDKTAQVEVVSRVTTFVYVFSIEKLLYTGGQSFRMTYKCLQCRYRLSNLLRGFRRSLQSSLDNIDVILASCKYLEYQDPFKRTFTMFQPWMMDRSSLSQIYEILLEGLKENYLYIQRNPKLCESKHAFLLKNLLEKMKKIKRAQEKLAVEGDEENVSYSDEEMDLDITKPIESSIIQMLMQRESTGTFVALNEALSPQVKILPQASLEKPYVFLIHPKRPFPGHYVMVYQQRKEKVVKDLNTRCRIDILNTVQTVKQLLTTPPKVASFINPLSSDNTEITSPQKLWPVILQGLLEMKFFYNRYSKPFLALSRRYHPEKELDDVIERILKEKSNLCGTPITESQILTKLMFPDLQAEAPVPLASQSIELFDLESQQVASSDEEDMEVEQASKDNKNTSQSAEELKVPARFSQKSVLPAPIGHIRQKNQPMTYIVVPIFSIELLPRSIPPLFSFQYSTRYCSKQAHKIKTTLHNIFHSSLTNLLSILESEGKCRIKWKEVSLVGDSQETYFLDKKTLFLRALQGFEAVHYYLQEHHNHLLQLHPKGQIHPQKSLEKIVTILKEQLKDISPVVLSNLSQSPISDITTLLPHQLLSKLVQEKKAALIQEKEKIKEIITPPVIEKTKFIYLFSVNKHIYGTSDHKMESFLISYKYLESSKHIFNLVRGIRRSLKSSLGKIDTLLTKPQYVEYLDPTENISIKLSQPSSQLYQILLQGLEENYLYITQAVPMVFQGKYALLKTALEQQIRRVRQVKLAVEDGMVDNESEIVDPNASSSIIKQLITAKTSETYESLESTLSLQAKLLSQTALKNPYLFLVRVINPKRVSNHHHYRIAYQQCRETFTKSLNKKCRTDIMKTVACVQQLLESSPDSVSFIDPFLTDSSDITEPKKLWPIILQGLLEMQFFYNQHADAFLVEASTVNPGKAIADLVQRILEEKADLCGAPITESSVISRLMESSLSGEGASGLQESASSDDDE